MNIYQLYYNIESDDKTLNIESQKSTIPEELDCLEIEEIENSCISCCFKDMSMNKKNLVTPILPFFKLRSGKYCIYKVSAVKESQYFYHILVLDCNKTCFERLENTLKFNVKEEYLITNKEFQESGFKANGETIENFFRFMGYFDYKIIDWKISYIQILFEVINCGFKEASCSNIIEALDFANDYSSKGIFEKITFRMDEEELMDLISCVPQKDIEIIFKFLLKTLSLSDNKECIDKAYSILFNCIHFLVSDMYEVEATTIMEICDNMKKFNEFSIEKFIIKTAEDIRIERLIVFLENVGKPRHAYFYLCSLLGEFIALEEKQKSKVFWNIFDNSSDLKKFVDLCLKILINSQNEFRDVLKYIAKDLEYITNIMNISYELCSSMDNYNVVIWAYSELLLKLDSDTVKKMNTKLMDKNYGGDILIFVYKNRIKNADNKKKYFIKYCINVFDENEEYRKKYFSLALEELLVSFNNYDFNIEFYKSFTRYIEERNLEKYIGKLLASKLVYKFQNVAQIEIPSESSKSVIEEMNYIKRLYDVEVSPDISEMIHFADLLNRRTISVERFLCYEKKLDFEGIDEEKYEKALNLLFKVICPQLKDVSSHMKMMNMLMYNKFFNVYFTAYLNEMSEILSYSDESNINVKNSYKIYLDFVCFIIKSKNLFSEKQYRDIEKFIVSSLEKAKIYDFGNFNEYMDNIISSISKNKEAKKIRREWQKMYKPLSENEKIRNIITKIKRITSVEK
ncbi:hypothetical protein [Clostridium hydrogenum]|uniref:hypothetical protein n=1 Tax=Clostridium hydrogenum TaxID=2855764 RepID=UPI001F2D31EE|nr:hypothetical protein [Clostridium hydrogenum]